MMLRRKSIRKDDPLEELQELYGEVKDQENKFKKCLEVCGKISTISFRTLIVYI